MIHSTAEVQTGKIGDNSMVWQFSVILEGAVVGNDCNINSHTFIENDVVIGDRVTIKCGVYVWDGITIEDDVFVGPNVTFTNDLTPRSKVRREILKTRICRGASIGGGAIILPGLEVGEYAMIGAAAVVTKSVVPYALMVGSPARRVGWVNKNGEKLVRSAEDFHYIDSSGQLYRQENEHLIKTIKK
jgi:UDP-2-acetamido-3-amino-2,3-dideoxy-glucuronate N-acetyltransferase